MNTEPNRNSRDILCPQTLSIHCIRGLLLRNIPDGALRPIEYKMAYLLFFIDLSYNLQFEQGIDCFSENIYSMSKAFVITSF